MKSVALFALTLVIFLAGPEFLSGGSVSSQQHPSIYKEPVMPSKLPQGKFRHGHPNAIAGEYLVFFNAEVKELEVEKLADELVEKYGGGIKTNDLVMETKQEDGTIKTEILARGKKVLFTKTNKGFAVQMTEAEARSLSEDARVDYVTENVSLPAPASQNRPVGISNPGNVIKNY